jgi:hypothetical protein
VTIEPVSTSAEKLAPEEVRALAEAAAWYAKYHEQLVASSAGDQSAMAIARRERFETLHGALQKLGIRIRRPDGL